MKEKILIRAKDEILLSASGRERCRSRRAGITYFINGTNKFMSLKKLDYGFLNIGATTTISENYLMPYLKKFHDLYPNITINITNDLTDNLIKNLRNGNLDIVIMAIPKYSIKDLKISYLTDLNDAFVGGVKYKNKKYNNLESILKEEILLQKKPSVTRNNFDDYIKEKNIIFNPKMEIVSHNLLTKLIEENFGIGLVTKEFISDKLNKSLFEINIPENIPKRKLGFAVKDDTFPSFTTKKFIELLKEKSDI